MEPDARRRTARREPRSNPLSHREVQARARAVELGKFPIPEAFSARIPAPVPELQALEPVCREQDNCTDVGSCRSPRTNSSTCSPRTTRLCGRSRRFCGCSQSWCAAPLVLGASIPAPLPRLLLAGHWLWAGLVYHAWFFTAINPAAWLFAALFVAQGVLFIAFRSSARQPLTAPGRPAASSRHC